MFESSKIYHGLFTVADSNSIFECLSHQRFTMACLPLLIRTRFLSVRVIKDLPWLVYLADLNSMFECLSQQRFTMACLLLLIRTRFLSV